MDHRPQIMEAVLGGDVPDGAMQTDAVVMLDIIGDASPRLIQGGRASRPDTVAFDSLVEAFELSIRLGIVRAGADMCDADQADELFEVACQELGPVVGNDPGLFSG